MQPYDVKVQSKSFKVSQAISITLDEEVTDQSPSKIGRPKLSCNQAQIRLKHKLASDLAAETEFSTQHLLHAASVSVKRLKSIIY